MSYGYRTLSSTSLSPSWLICLSVRAVIGRLPLISVPVIGIGRVSLMLARLQGLFFFRS